jgi:hypothetical protein
MGVLAVATQASLSPSLGRLCRDAREYVKLAEPRQTKNSCSSDDRRLSVTGAKDALARVGERSRSVSRELRKNFYQRRLRA